MLVDDYIFINDDYILIDDDYIFSSSYIAT